MLSCPNRDDRPWEQVPEVATRERFSETLGSNEALRLCGSQGGADLPCFTPLGSMRDFAFEKSQNVKSQGQL